MQTLIELYDERAIENILAADMFRPQRIIFICAEDIAQDKARIRTLNSFFQRRGWKPEVEFQACSMYDSDDILRHLLSIHDRFPDCALDVTGGTDAALFAGGMFAAQRDVAAFTYSRKTNCFYNIRNAPFADSVPCRVKYRVEDFFLMAGGRMRPGRVDNRVLQQYIHLFAGFFALYLRHRKRWGDAVTWMQRASAENDTLDASGAFTLKGNQGRKVTITPALLEELQSLSLITDLVITPEETVSFRFADSTVRSWLRDVGSVLELYVYKACMDSGIFQDVVSSAVVDWENKPGHADVSNELDAVAARGALPLFISCKTCAIHTEALNELAILRDRFGGKGAKACIVTTEACNASARHRAAQLGITVVDLEELKKGGLVHRLKVIMKTESDENDLK